MTNETFKIHFPFAGLKDDKGELNIESENLWYAEIMGASGCQVVNAEKQEEIHELCIKISKLFKELVKLNKDESKG